MSVNLPTHFVQEYSRNINLLLQQKGSKLADTVMQGMHVGKQASPVDQIGAVNANKVITRFAPMPRIDAPLDRRWVYPTDYDLPQLIDSFDKLRLLTDPESSYVLNATYAMGRAKDDEIIAAAVGTARTGEQGGTSVTFPTAQSVSVNTGGAASALNVAKLRAAKRLLMSNDVDFDMEEIWVLASSTDLDALLNEIQIISLDFNEKPVLAEGKVTRFLGMNFKHVERPLMTATATDDAAGQSRAVPVYVKSGMYLGTWGGVETNISKRNDLQGEPWQAYTKETIGATRLEEKKVVRIWAR